MNNNNNNNESSGRNVDIIIDDDDDERRLRSRLIGKPNTDFNENDGRDSKILSQHQLPLNYSWTLWHTAPKEKRRDKRDNRNSSKKNDQGWTDNYKKIASFDTVGTFWQLFNNIGAPTMLRPGSSYHLFKGKVEPKWEDQFNKGGGSWTYRFGFKGNKGKEDISNVINYAWYYTVLNMIGNNFRNYQNICGVVVNLKQGNRTKEKRLQETLYITIRNDGNAVKQ